MSSIDYASKQSQKYNCDFNEIPAGNNIVAFSVTYARPCSCCQTVAMLQETIHIMGDQADSTIICLSCEQSLTQDSGHQGIAFQALEFHLKASKRYLPLIGKPISELLESTQQ